MMRRIDWRLVRVIAPTSARLVALVALASGSSAKIAGAYDQRRPKLIFSVLFPRRPRNARRSSRAPRAVPLIH
jgi:hypothetical protein